MVVGCPKCKAKLKVPDEKIKPEGTKIRCPKCKAMLLVKRPAKKAAPPPPPPQRPSPRPEPPSYIEKDLPIEREPWPDMPSETPVREEEEPRTGTPGPSFEREPWPEIPETHKAPPFEEEPEPEAPPPPFEEEPEPETPPAPFEEEPEPEAPPVPFEEEPQPEAPASMETVMETQAPPSAPAEKEVKKEIPPLEEPAAEAPQEAVKVLLAFPDPQVVNMLKFILSGANFTVSSATDGVTAIVKVLKELPAVLVADVRLSKIHGIELMKRLRSRAETRDIKVILTGSKPEQEMPEIEGASGYIQQDSMQQGLVDLIRKALAQPAAAPTEETSAPKPGGAVTEPAAYAADAGVQRAKRFARTVLSDIELYNKEKVDQSIRDGNFESVFAKELQEGRKLYEMRIPADARRKGSFFEDAINTFMEKKRHQLGI